MHMFPVWFYLKTADCVEKLKTAFSQGMSKSARRRDRQIPSDCERRSFWPNLPFRQKASFSTASARTSRSMLSFDLRSGTMPYHYGTGGAVDKSNF